MRTRLLLLMGFFLLVPGLVFAAVDLALENGDVSFSNQKPYAGEVVRMYASVRNVGQQDARGSVRFKINNTQLGALQPFSVVTGGTATVFVDWEPNEGYYSIGVELANVDPADGTAGNNAVLIANFLVDKDTDGDGRPDTVDFDDDGDGIDDGVELTMGTDPLRWDTDGDGVNDKDDAFPLDPARSSEPTPQPEPPPASLELSETLELEPPKETAPAPAVERASASQENREFSIEEVTYTFPGESEATHTLELQIAKSRLGWHTWQFEALGGTPEFVYLWDFGDGKLSQSKEALHSFPGAGEYAVTLTASDSAGGLGSATLTVGIGFWHFGNPWVKMLIGLLGVFGAGLVALVVWNKLPPIKKE